MVCKPRNTTTEKLSDGLIQELAENIGSKQSDVLKLGIALGCEKSAIDRYVASNNQNGSVSTNGTTEMLFDWKKRTSAKKQKQELSLALRTADLIELADDYFPESDNDVGRAASETTRTTVPVVEIDIQPDIIVDENDNDVGRAASETTRTTVPVVEIDIQPDIIVDENASRSFKEKLQFFQGGGLDFPAMSSVKLDSGPRLETSTTQTECVDAADSGPRLETSTTQTECVDAAESPELLCLKCDRVTATITDVINTKRSEKAVHSKVRNIKGRQCLVQLMEAIDPETKELTGRYDVITLTTADVKLGDEVYPWSYFDVDGYKEHICTRCEGCSQQVGWYYVPEDTKSAPFHALFLQRLIHDSYDSDNSLNAFYAKNRDEE